MRPRAVVPATGRTGYASQVDDTEHHAVAKLRSRDQRRKLRIKDVRFQRLNDENIVQRIRFLQLVQFFLRRRIAGIDQVIQLRQGLMQIITVTNGGGFFPDGTPRRADFPAEYPCT